LREPLPQEPLQTRNEVSPWKRGNADDEIVAKLHDELLLNVFHAEIANAVKDYKDAKSKKMSTNDSSDVSFRTALKCASEKHEIKT
jgi:hypothetical protein